MNIGSLFILLRAAERKLHNFILAKHKPAAAIEN
jgi:hypothetical protein